MIVTALLTGIASLALQPGLYGALVFLAALPFSAYVYALLSRPPYEYPAIKQLEADVATLKDKLDRAILTGGRRG